jgi:uncharacterized protein YjiS (DUF1127 family)
MTVLDDILSAAATPIAWRRTFIFLARMRRHIERMVAVVIARRERHAALAVLRHLSGRELRDIGIYRSDLDYGLEAAARERSRMQLGPRATSQRARTDRQ